VLVLGGVNASYGAEPTSLERYGLAQLQPLSDSQGQEVRGTAIGASATGLTTGSMYLYDPWSGSRFSWDSTQFGRSEDASYPTSRSSAQVLNTISTAGPFSVSFPSGLTASVSVFRLSGASMGLASGNSLWGSTP